MALAKTPGRPCLPTTHPYGMFEHLVKKRACGVQLDFVYNSRLMSPTRCLISNIEGSRDRNPGTLRYITHG